MEALLARLRRDDGLGLVEILIAMAVLTVLSLSFLPMLAGGLKVAEQNTTLSMATQLSSAQLNLARSQPATCSALATFAASAASVVSGNGTPLTATRSMGSCTSSSSYPMAVTVTVSVSGGGSVLATATTSIYVASYS